MGGGDAIRLCLEMNGWNDGTMNNGVYTEMGGRTKADKDEKGYVRLVGSCGRVVWSVPLLSCHHKAEYECIAVYMEQLPFGDRSATGADLLLSV